MQLETPIRLIPDSVPGRSRLVISGRVTVAECADLHRAALQLVRQHQDAIVDLSATESLDTAAIQVLMVLRRDVETIGKTLEILGAAPSVRNDLRLLGWDGLGR